MRLLPATASNQPDKYSQAAGAVAELLAPLMTPASRPGFISHQAETFERAIQSSLCMRATSFNVPRSL